MGVGERRGRVPRLTRKFTSRLLACGGGPNTRLSQALGRTIAEMAEQDLPTERDRRIAVPPVRHAWVRQVEGEAVWLYFEIEEEELVLVNISLRCPF